jgi:hypothetical protein
MKIILDIFGIFIIDALIIQNWNYEMKNYYRNLLENAIPSKIN